jgi:hypothetical protein
MAMNTKPAVDQYARRIAGASSLIAGSVAVFWIVQLVRGVVPPDAILIANILLFGAIAYMFGRLTKGGSAINVAAMFGFMLTAGRLEKQEFGVPGRGTFLAAVMLFFANAVLHDRRRRAAEPAAAADGLRRPLIAHVVSRTSDEFLRRKVDQGSDPAGGAAGA